MCVCVCVSASGLQEGDLVHVGVANVLLIYVGVANVLLMCC